MFIFFIITTTAGALTGVGIWFSVALGQPVAIGSLLRVFFWAWFSEWLVFISEIALIVIYFFTWHRISKKLHIKIGFAYAFMSWMTMAIITGVLAAMLTPGEWLVSRSFWDAFLNPTWLPSLFFRTAVAVALTAGFALLYASLAWPKGESRDAIISYTGKWLLGSTLFIPLTGTWYISRIPQEAKELLVWASGFINTTTFTYLNTLGAAVIILISAVAIWRSKNFPKALAVIVVILSIFYIGEMEMVREKARKPYMIYGYLYANGFTVKEAQELNQIGVLTASKWSSTKQVTEHNHLAAGRDVFKIQCSSCHTIHGWNSRRDIAQLTDGWPEKAIDGYVANLHSFRYFMPPFIGTPEERKALSTWIYSLQVEKEGEL